MTPISIVKVAKTIQYYLDSATGQPVSVGMRRPGSATPAVVWEMTSAECSIILQGHVGQSWIVGCEVQIYGDDALGVLGVADSLISFFDATPITPGTLTPLTLTGLSVSMRTESQADGSEGDERVCTLSLTFQGD